jgi:hypothetical protein
VKRTRELYLKGLRFWISEATPERVSTCTAVHKICTVSVLEGSKGTALSVVWVCVYQYAASRRPDSVGGLQCLVSHVSLLRHTCLSKGSEMTASVVCDDAFAVNAPLFTKKEIVLDYCLSCRSRCTHSSTNLCRHAARTPLHDELNPSCYLLALLGAHHILHFSSIRVKLQAAVV